MENVDLGLIGKESRMRNLRLGADQSEEKG